MFVNDQATPLSREKTRDGFLRVRARVGRAGLHDYKAGEIGAPGLPPDASVRVYRPPEAVFEPASMASFAGLPVTLDHPPAMIDSANWKRFAVGHSGPSVERDADHLVADLVITDAEGVARAEAGTELSNGYWADFDFTPGVTPAGEPFDARQGNIRGNHIALVDQGRCGATCRIGDAAEPGDAGADATSPDGCRCAPAEAARDAESRTVTLDGTTFAVSAEGAAAIARLKVALDDARAAHRREVAVRDGEIAALKAEGPHAVALERLCVERGDAIEGARAILGPAFDGRGLTVDAIRRAAVGKTLGADRVRGRDDAYVAAAFDAIVARASAATNGLAAHLASGLADAASSREAAFAARNRYLARAWKGEDQGVP